MTTTTVILLVGSAAIVGSTVMALALIFGSSLLERRSSATEGAPTEEFDTVGEHFDEAIKDLMPLFIADFPGIPLGDTEEQVIRDLERGIRFEDPDFIELFRRGDTH